MFLRRILLAFRGLFGDRDTAPVWDYLLVFYPVYRSGDAAGLTIDQRAIELHGRSINPIPQELLDNGALMWYRSTDRKADRHSDVVRSTESWSSRAQRWVTL